MTATLYGILALLALVGGALSFYFWNVYKGYIKPAQWWVPVICQLENNICSSIVNTAYGSIAGIPNALSGTIFLAIYAVTLFGTALGKIPAYVPFIMGLFTMIVGLYLVVGLIKLSAKCMVCLVVHILNLIIFALQLIQI